MVKKCIVTILIVACPLLIFANLYLVAEGSDTYYGVGSLMSWVKTFPTTFDFSSCRYYLQGIVNLLESLNYNVSQLSLSFDSWDFVISILSGFTSVFINIVAIGVQFLLVGIPLLIDIISDSIQFVYWLCSFFEFFGY